MAACCLGGGGWGGANHRAVRLRVRCLVPKAALATTAAAAVKVRQRRPWLEERGAVGSRLSVSDHEGSDTHTDAQRKPNASYSGSSAGTYRPSSPRVSTSSWVHSTSFGSLSATSEVSNSQHTASSR
eukprot:2762649-Prymnesium_polylepis.1